MVSKSRRMARAPNQPPLTKGAHSIALAVIDAIWADSVSPLWTPDSKPDVHRRYGAAPESASAQQLIIPTVPSSGFASARSIISIEPEGDCHSGEKLMDGATTWVF
jgi:hypothetical protein